MKIASKPCKTCARQGTFDNGKPGCAKFKIPIDLENDFCSWHIPLKDTFQCDLCHSKVENLIIWISQDETKEYLVCTNCLSKIGTCATCYYQHQCEFISDRTEPLYVNKTVQQGFITMQTQIKNPHLVDKHCISCRCSYSDDPNHACQKDDGGVFCKNWMII